MSLLVAIYIINHLDRQVVNILAEPIKRDLGLADWQVGLMSGLAFAVLYSILGIPIARTAERGNRPLIIGAATVVWSAFTMVCGLAQNFAQLILARIGVGIGEAGCTPPAHSLILDINPPEKRSSALAIYGMGAPLGALTGMAFGGLIADAHGWRTAFLLAGLPGILFAILAVTTLREPRKVAPPPRADAPARTATFADTMRLLRGKPTFWFVIVGSAIKALVVMGIGAFTASFFLRNHAEGIAAAATSLGDTLGIALQPMGYLGIMLGLLSGVFGVLGMWSGGYLADRLGARNQRYYLIVPAVAALITVPTYLGTVMAGALFWAMVMQGLHAYFGGFSYGPTYGTALGVVPPHMRATASALMLLASNLIGLGIGPLLVGLLSDVFAQQAGDAEGLREALIVASWVGIVPAVLFLFGSRTIAADLHR